jgi:hypothetical protein
LNQDKITEIIINDRKEWQLLTSSLDAHPGKTLHATPADPWNNRDVYAHLARWMEYSTREIKAYLAGHNLSEPVSNPEEINAYWQTLDSQLSLAEARQKAHDAFEERIATIRSIPLERWDFKLEKMVEYDGSEHYKMHRNYIHV